MILYESGENHLAFIFRYEGSLLPRAGIFAIPSVILSVLTQLVLRQHPWFEGPGSGVLAFAWSVAFFALTFLVGFRCNRAYERFWEGCTQLQQMSAEWFESA